MALRTMLTARTAIETVRGTGVTPTRLWYFEEGEHEQEVGTIRPLERRASWFESFRAYPGIERDRIRFSGDVTYDQFALIIAVAVKGGLTGSGASADKTWTAVPEPSTDSLKSLSVQFGYADGIGASNPAWEVDGCMANELTLRWEKGDAVRYDIGFISHKGATQISAFTGSLSDRTEVSALGTATQVYIDTTTIGSTADANIVSAEWTLNNNLAILDTLNNTAIGASVQRPDPRTWSLKLTRVYANDTERDIYLTKAIRKVRIKSVGPSLGGSNYSLQVDCYGVIDSITNSDVDGIGAEEITLVPLYDATATTDFGMVLVNSLAAIT